MNGSWKKLRPQVLRRIKPSASLTRAASAASRRVQELARTFAGKIGAQIEPRLVGSLAKDTHLRPAPDIDVFLLFDPTTSREELEEKGIRIGKRVLRRAILKYAEHPYVHGRFGRFVFDVVPAYKIREAKGRLSAVDRSPFHAAYVTKKLTPGQRDEVRLLKQFLKGIECYGAETATSGFSGYLAELLILKFRDFEGVVKAFGTSVAPRRLAIGRASAESLGGEFVFVDPVDATRNAAAAVSADRFDRFVRACHAFRLRPSKEFFWPTPAKPADRSELRSHLDGRGVFALEVPAPQIRLDAVAPHLRRLSDKIARRLVDEGFHVKGRLVEPVSSRTQLLLWEYAPAELADHYDHRGPPADDADNSRRFLQKWQGHPDALDNPHPVGGRWRVKVRRHDRTPRAILKSKVPEILQGVELPAAQRERARVRDPDELLSRENGRLALTKLLLGRDPWER